ncbi:MAG: PRC-barrel domain-containing protein [Roseibium sp.]
MTMKTKLIAASLLSACLVGGAGTAMSQHTAGGVLITHTEINVGLVAEGWSIVKLLRGKVYNEKDEFVGYVHDAIVTPEGETSFVIVNVAGFLNVGTRLIALPTAAFEVKDDSDLLLPMATKESLATLPAFIYAAD